ncbi:MAG: hypothetical protein J7K21_00330 [Desulfurococcales archaeon]|nr:hypothetical protein [Desulfurococcales archaeon]
MPRYKYMYTIFLFSLLALAGIVYFVYFYSYSVEGYYTIEIHSGNEIIENVILELPLLENNEPVYKVKDISVTIVSGSEVLKKPSITVIEEAYGYPYVISIPVNLKGDITIKGEFTIEKPELLDYSMYPWRVVVAGEEYSMPISFERNIVAYILLYISQYSNIIIPLLTALAITTGTISLYMFSKGAYYQVAPVSGKKCKWCKICVRFFKLGPGLEDNKQLPKDYIEKLLELLIGVNRIWEKCCIKFIPCLDKDHNVIAKTINIDKEVEFPLPLKGAIEDVIEIDIRLYGKINAKKLFKKDGKGIILNKGVVEETYSETVRATWKRNIEYEKKEYRAGQSVPRNVLEKILSKRINEINKKLKGKEKNPDLVKERDFLNRVLEDVKAGSKERRGRIDVLTVLKHLVIRPSGPYTDRCIDVFIVESFEDTAVKKDEKGYASIPGREVIIEESTIIPNPIPKILAHELGHNLGLDHVKPPKKESSKRKHNLMEPITKGTSLEDTQCRKAIGECTNDKLKQFNEDKCGRGEDILQLRILENENRELSERINDLEKSLKNVNKTINKYNKDLKLKKKKLGFEESILRIMKGKLNRVKKLRRKLESPRKRTREYARKELDSLKRSYMRELNKYRERLKKYMEKPSIYKNSIARTKEYIEKYTKLTQLVEDPEPEKILNKQKDVVGKIKAEIEFLENSLKSLPKLRDKIVRELNEKKKLLAKNKKMVSKLGDRLKHK